MPDTHYTDLPSRTLTAATVRAAQLRVATASREAYPDEGDPRAGWDCARLLEILGLDQS